VNALKPFKSMLPRGLRLKSKFLLYVTNVQKSGSCTEFSLLDIQDGVYPVRPVSLLWKASTLFAPYSLLET
jgi:hypothetical protein